MAIYEKLKNMTISLKRDMLSTAATYDATLFRNIAYSTDIKLTLQLNIYLKQINPTTLPHTLDSNGRLFWIKPWSSTDWQKFHATVKQEADLWNYKFWLKPPRDFTDYDNVSPIKKTRKRPYIRCELDVVITPVPELAHQTVGVANLNLNQYLNPRQFRSARLLWNSQDFSPMISINRDDAGNLNVTSSPVIAHEIGHHLGLHHIGLLQKTALCQAAVILEGHGMSGEHPDAQGGENSNYCYGWDQPAKVGENIMGQGSTFTVDNAKPWVWAMTMFRNNSAEVWQVLTSDPGPNFPVLP